MSSLANYQLKVVPEPERIDVFLTRSCVQVTDISCGVVYEATLASLVLFRSYCYVFLNNVWIGTTFLVALKNAERSVD